MPSSGAALEFIATTAQFITFHVTDGDSSRRPENTQAPPASTREVNWHRTMKMDEKYACRWRNLIGQGIAKLLEKPDKEKYCLEAFPEGYCMFDHNKGPVSNIRHDLYLHGSKTVLRFRSPAEFIPHGYWLLTDPTLNPKNCGCKYCGGGGKKTQTEISEALGLPTNRGPTAVTGSTSSRIGGLRSGKGSGPVASTDGSWVLPAKRQPPKIDPAWAMTSLGLELAANSDRISDLRSHRRFRQGELVWCSRDIETALSTAEGNNCDRWANLGPAVISDYNLETSTARHPHASEFSVLQRRVYYVRRLGTPSSSVRAKHDCMLHEDEILPWLAHRAVSSDSSSIRIARLKRSFDPLAFALKVADHLVTFWAVCDRLPIKVPAASSLAHATGTETVDINSSRSVVSPILPSASHSNALDKPSPSFRSTPSLHVPPHVDPTPPQRSPVRLVPPSPASRSHMSRPMAIAASLNKLHSGLNKSHSESLPAQRIHNTRGVQPQKNLTVTQTRYQGLWYGAERIWTGDLVRLCPEREAFSESLRLTMDKSTSAQRRITPSPGATMRAVLMRVDRIFARIGESGTKECAVAGPLYEIAPKEWTDGTELVTNATQRDLSLQVSTRDHFYPWDITSSPPPSRNERQLNHTQSPDLTSFPLPPAPPGYKLRPLLPSGSELPVPVSFIAGRYYPDLFQWPLLSSVFSNGGEVSSLNQPVVTSAELRSLCALAPGKINHAVCVDVKLANRARMLEDAIRMAKTELGEELNDDLFAMDID